VLFRSRLPRRAPASRRHRGDRRSRRPRQAAHPEHEGWLARTRDDGPRKGQGEGEGLPANDASPCARLPWRGAVAAGRRLPSARAPSCRDRRHDRTFVAAFLGLRRRCRGRPQPACLREHDLGVARLARRSSGRRGQPLPAYFRRPRDLSRGASRIRFEMRGMKRRSRTVSASVRAFTLVEVLVVVAIIGILASLSVAGLRIAQIHAREGAVKHEISLLKAAAETFGREMGDFPPSRWSFFRVSGVNAENDGNEILLLCLLSRKKGGRSEEDFEEDRLLNADGDTLPPAALAVIRKELHPPPTSGAPLE